MTFQAIEQKSNKWSLWLFAMVLVALATSYFLRTPELTKKAETLQAVQSTVIPALKARAGCEEWRANTNENLARLPTVVDPKAIPKDCPPLKVK